jgi:hypothetical protein
MDNEAYFILPVNDVTVMVYLPSQHLCFPIQQGPLPYPLGYQHL